jgi:3-oxoacyl-[acyl-carrier-protein] synthase II
MSQKRVVITGMGLVSCFGSDIETFYNALLEGKSGISLIEKFDCSEYPTKIAGSIKDFDPGDYVDQKILRRMDPFIHYTLVAGKKAIESSGLNLEEVDPERIGVVVGSGMGGMQSFEGGIETLITKGYRRISPFFIPSIITNMGGGLLAMELGLYGPNYSVSTACATGNHALFAALNHIRAGQADIMVCGSAEAAITPMGLTSFIACKAVSKENDVPEKASKPWDENRSGFVMGEGAGIFVLESLESAQARGATIYAEVLGGAIGCDAYHMTDPRPDGSGAAQCIKLALKDAGIEKEDVSYINAHGTSTPVGDKAEVAAIRSVFKDHISNLKMNSTKSMIGHCLGAAASIEAVAVVQALRTKKLHPTINLENPDPCIDGINCCPKGQESLEGDIALSNSFGFGGHNSCMIFRRWGN